MSLPQDTQSQVGHTPGPWVVDDRWIVKVPLLPIAELNCSEEPLDGGSWQANARLIAAAPDLLAALERIAEFNEQPFDDAFGPESISDQWNNKAGLINAIAQAVIKKAKGA